MFSFFKRHKKPSPETAPVATDTPPVSDDTSDAAAAAQVVAPDIADTPTTPQAGDGVSGTPDAAEADRVPPGSAEIGVAQIPDVSPSLDEMPASSGAMLTDTDTDIGAEPSAAGLTPEVAAVPEIDSVAAGASEPPVPAVVPDTSSETAQTEAAPGKKRSWLQRLKQGLSKTGQNIGGLFVGVKVDEDLFEELETALIMADAGMEATERLLTGLRARVRKDKLTDASQVKAALIELLTEQLLPLQRAFPLDRPAPQVVMIAGVNGAGKTTSIGKLANAFQAQGKKVLLAAGDTFRAAAREQLVVWGQRNNVAVIAQEGGDPAAVAFDAVNAGRARGMDIVMVDTAGRLPTQLHLMEEIKKIRRVINKADDQAPHEVLLVVDGTTGQNALAQIRAFDAAIELTGLVVTKLDGTAKGGVLAAVAAGSQGVRPIPVYWIGVGESMDDLQPFVASEFATALVG